MRPEKLFEVLTVTVCKNSLCLLALCFNRSDTLRTRHTRSWNQFRLGRFETKRWCLSLSWQWRGEQIRVPATTCEQPVAAAAAESGCPPLQPAAHEVVRPGRSTAESRERGGQEETLGDSRRNMDVFTWCVTVKLQCIVSFLHPQAEPAAGGTTGFRNSCVISLGLRDEL